MMWKIKVSLSLILLMGCHSHKPKGNIKEENHKTLPELPKHFLIPTSPPKYNVQINPVPFPFNVTGSYVVWVNNERIHLNKNQLDTLVSKLNLSTERPKDTAEIHNGEGWLRPFSNSTSLK
jgi:hypothetical protein